LNVQPDEARISNAELRIFAPGKETGGAGIITGSVGYQFSTKNVSAELVGAGLPLRNIEKIQSDRLPISGQISFHLKASGPYQAPVGDGTMRVVDFRVGQEIIGSFDGELHSDGKTAKLDLHSAMSGGGISGGRGLRLAGLVERRGRGIDVQLGDTFRIGGRPAPRTGEDGPVRTSDRTAQGRGHRSTDRRADLRRGGEPARICCTGRQTGSRTAGGVGLAAAAAGRESENGATHEGAEGRHSKTHRETVLSCLSD